MQFCLVWSSDASVSKKNVLTVKQTIEIDENKKNEELKIKMRVKLLLLNFFLQSNGNILEGINENIIRPVQQV